MLLVKCRPTIPATIRVAFKNFIPHRVFLAFTVSYSVCIYLLQIGTGSGASVVVCAYYLLMCPQVLTALLSFRVFSSLAIECFCSLSQHIQPKNQICIHPIKQPVSF